MADLRRLPAAADALGMSASRLKRLRKRPGFPVAREGSRGRGNASLYDVDAIAAWLRSDGADDALRAFAGRVPELTAKAASSAFDEIEGDISKRMAARVLAAHWVVVTDILLEALGAPPASAVPEVVEKLEKIGT